MSWTTPVIDWAPSDTISETDLNAIGANLEVLRNTYEFSGAVTNNLQPLPRDMYRIAITVPVGKTLILRRWRVSVVAITGTSPAPMTALIEGETAYDPSSAEIETTPDFTLYSNVTAAPVTKIFKVRATGTLPTYTVDDGSGFHAVVEVIDTPT